MDRTTQDMIPEAGPQTRCVPLCVDLDGTLAKTDLSWMAVLSLVSANPFSVFKLLWWLRGGLAHLKARIAAAVDLDLSSIPWTSELVEYLQDEKRKGRKLVLCTAADAAMARKVAAYWGFFDEVLASDGKTNLRGRAKAEALVSRFGAGGFDYAGNSIVDLPVWARARHALVVNASKVLCRLASKHSVIADVFPRPRAAYLALLESVLVSELVRNMVVFAPVVAFGFGGQAGPLALVKLAALFVAFCMSTVGLVLLDRVLDLVRQPGNRRNPPNPVVSGEIAASLALYVGAALLVLAVVLAIATGLGLGMLVLVGVLAGILNVLLAWPVFPANLVLNVLQDLVRVVAGAQVLGIVPPTRFTVFWVLLLLALEATCVPEPQSGLQQIRHWPGWRFQVALAAAVGSIMLAGLNLGAVGFRPLNLALWLGYTYWVLALVHGTGMKAPVDGAFRYLCSNVRLAAVGMALVLGYLLA